MASCKTLDSANSFTILTQRIDANTVAIIVVLAEVTLAAAEEVDMAVAVADMAAAEEVDMAAAEEASAAVTRCPSLVPVSSNKLGVSSFHYKLPDQHTNHHRHGHPP